MKPSDLDTILTLQLAVAWAGEAETQPPRLRWWRTALNDPGAGEDLFRRLTPTTWRWATLEAARLAARRTDEAARKRSEDPDHLITLFRLGFETDEHLDDRLRELKQSGALPSDAIPSLATLTASWSREAFEAWLQENGAGEPPKYTSTATGRRLTGEMPRNPTETARRLASALFPWAEAYPVPHFRVAR